MSTPNTLSPATAITNGIRYAYDNGDTLVVATGDVTLISTDRRVLMNVTAAAVVTLPALDANTAGLQFSIIDVSAAGAAANTISIKDAAAATVTSIYPGNANGSVVILNAGGAWRYHSQSLSASGVNTGTVADNGVIGGVEVVHVVAVADGVTADTDVVLTYKTEVTRIEVIKTSADGGASDTITVKNGATAITNAMSINVVDKTVVRPTTIDDAATVIAAAGTLRVTRTKASAANVACRVLVYGVRRA
jgi:hypothetical protein